MEITVQIILHKMKYVNNRKRTLIVKNIEGRRLNKRMKSTVAV